MSGQWASVVSSEGPRSGQGWGSRRGRCWVLTLDCGHTAERPVTYKPLPGQRGGQGRERDLHDVLPAPRRAMCWMPHDPVSQDAP
jgi:hypothetical protein